jgi:hypothetical protein
MRSSVDIFDEFFSGRDMARKAIENGGGGCLFRETKVRRIRTHSPDWVIVADREFASLADILPCLSQTRNVGIARERKQ